MGQDKTPQCVVSDLPPFPPLEFIYEISAAVESREKPQRHLTRVDQDYTFCGTSR
jgi:hypothetical protein